MPIPPKLGPIETGEDSGLTMSAKHSRIINLLLGVSALGCFPGKVVDTSDVTTREDSTSDNPTTSDDPTGNDTEGTPSEASTGDGDGEPDSEDETETWGFVPSDDWPSCASSCDTFAQDCPEGEKCVPGPWSGACGAFVSCNPVVGDGLPGESCTVGDGDDDCNASSWCYPALLGLDGPALCIEHCGGTGDNPTCSSPDEVCVFDRGTYDGVLGCRSRCDPLAPEGCLAIETCTIGVPDQPDFGCMIASDSRGPGESCSANQECDAGLCVDTEELPACADDRCCASFCDLLAPDCPIATECVAIELVDNPESTVGVCKLPE